MRLHAWCVVLSDSVSPCAREFPRVCMHVSTCVAVLLGVRSLFRTNDDHSADHHLSPCSHVDLVIKQGRAPPETT